MAAAGLCFLLHAAGAAAQRVATMPNDAAVVRLLGTRAESTFAPSSRHLAALVAIPEGRTAQSLGLEPVVPGIGRLRARAATLDAFARAHGSLALELLPPLRPLLDRAGRWVRSGAARTLKGADGTGVLVGVADTGIDITHRDLRDAQGRTRVKWLLDLSLPPTGGKYKDLEEQFGLRDDQGKVLAGAVYGAEDIDAMIAAGRPRTTDEVGHGTHVTSIAAGNGGADASARYVGVAPNADILFARVSRGSTDSIEGDALLQGVRFLFDRADAMGRPIAVNLSVGTDYGPHDGTLLWEQTLASYVGPDRPGHVLVVAAGNSGSIAQTPTHQNVHVAHGGMVRVPITSGGAPVQGAVQVWVAMREGASLSVGLRGPREEWIAPVAPGSERGVETADYRATVVNGSRPQRSPVPEQSRGAVVLWTGQWAGGTYEITLEGDGTADLYLQALGDAADAPTGFAAGVREGTINIPATHPKIIAVGCTVSRGSWESVDAGSLVGLRVPKLDGAGGLPAPASGALAAVDGEVCWFSSAGPNRLGVAKPEISAPGAAIVAAMSAEATPDRPASMFSSPNCPASKSGVRDARCFQVDDGHAVAVGTSMSAPFVAGAAALLLQQDPTLTQDAVVGLLQAGVHRLRAPSRFEDYAGPGELDVLGALDALEQMKHPALALPALATSWISVGAPSATADGSTLLVALIELRTADGEHRADLFDAGRLQPSVDVDGRPVSPLPALTRKAPGLWSMDLKLPAGLGGSSLRLGATFDGAPIVTPKAIAIATDAWASRYPPRVRGGCTAERGAAPPASAGAAATVGVLLAAARGHRARAQRGAGRPPSRDR